MIYYCHKENQLVSYSTSDWQNGICLNEKCTNGMKFTSNIMAQLELLPEIFIINVSMDRKTDSDVQLIWCLDFNLCNLYLVLLWIKTKTGKLHPNVIALRKIDVVENWDCWRNNLICSITKSTISLFFDSCDLIQHHRFIFLAGRPIFHWYSMQHYFQIFFEITGNLPCYQFHPTINNRVSSLTLMIF